MLKTIPIENLILSDNYRTEEDHEALSELAVSIREHGLLEPLVVRPIQDGKYEIIAGHRRYSALLMCFETHVECNVLEDIEADDAIILQLVENLQREDPSIWATAEVIAKLKRRGMSVKDIARKLGKSAAWVYRVTSDAIEIEQGIMSGKIKPEEVEHLHPGKGSSVAKVLRMGEQKFFSFYNKSFWGKTCGLNVKVNCKSVEDFNRLMEFINNESI